ncbi:MAG: cytochrome c3 family protein [Phycisphaerales bacterium]
MNPRPPAGTRVHTRRVRVRAAAVVGLLSLLVVWAGCTVTKQNYATLSLFFDGVPDPFQAPKGSEGPGDSTISATVVVHKPFAEEKCDVCHNSQRRPNRNDPSACYSCHESVGKEHAWVHGAVAGGACLWCHAPHESVRKWLLRSQDRKLCMQCHAATLMDGSVVPAHADPNIGCLECHFGHGGDGPLMLKPGAGKLAPPPPTDQEAPAVPADAAPSEPTPSPPLAPPSKSDT